MTQQLSQDFKSTLNELRGKAHFGQINIQDVELLCRHLNVELRTIKKGLFDQIIDGVVLLAGVAPMRYGHRSVSNALPHYVAACVMPRLSRRAAYKLLNMIAIYEFEHEDRLPRSAILALGMVSEAGVFHLKGLRGSKAHERFERFYRIDQARRKIVALSQQLAASSRSLGSPK